jgi:hypothetical protein
MEDHSHFPNTNLIAAIEFGYGAISALVSERPRCRRVIWCVRSGDCAPSIAEQIWYVARNGGGGKEDFDPVT